MVYGRINKPFWDDAPVAIIGGGPSLIDFDLEQLRGAHVLAVKRAIFSVPWADACFGLDMDRYTEWRDKLSSIPSRIYWAVTDDQLDRTTPSKNTTFLKRLVGQDVSDDPGMIFGGGTSGFGALQICLHKHAKEIVLFGFDYNGNDGTDAHSIKRTANWLAWAEHFRVYVPYLIEQGISVVNACPQSAIRCFQKMTLADGVAALRIK
jgi:hypothetical protein